MRQVATNFKGKCCKKRKFKQDVGKIQKEGQFRVGFYACFSRMLKDVHFKKKRFGQKRKKS